MSELNLYDYNLPEELIAYFPIPERGRSKMLVLDKITGDSEIVDFRDIISLLNSGDCLVVNNTKVIKARLYGKKNITGAEIEFLLIHPIDEVSKKWKCMIKPGKRVKYDSKVFIYSKNKKELTDSYFKVLTHNEDGTYTVEFSCDNAYKFIENNGHMPLPPYIKREDQLSDEKWYQTVYSSVEGAVAAPTAGLHFTEDIINELKKKNISVVEITLHVGAGTFQPVSVANLEKHKMHSEQFSIDKNAVAEINKAKQAGRRVIAVGTTTTRVLETVGDENGFVHESSGWTDIFIYPPKKLKVIDCMITNFHLPKSTLIMLVSAFAGREKIMKAYNDAVNAKLRFFSYGDCMFIK